MAVVVSDKYETLSQTSHARAGTAAEQAHRRLLQYTEDKQRKVDTLAQVVDRKKQEEEELRQEIEALRLEQANDDKRIEELKEKKLVFRVYAKIDSGRRGAVSSSQVAQFLGAGEEGPVDSLLWGGLPVTYRVTLRADDFDVAEVQAHIADAIQVPPEAVLISLPDGLTSGEIDVFFRLHWHMAPDDMHTSPDERQLRREAYFQQMGFESGVPDPVQGKAKEQQFRDVIRELTELGITVDRVSEEVVATFEDFYQVFWLKAETGQLPAQFLQVLEEARTQELSTILPEEAMDRITELEKLIARQVRANDVTRKEISDYEKNIETVDRHIHAAHKELTHVQEATGYHRLGTKPNAADFDIQVAQATELSALVARLKEEKIKGDQILRRKSQLIDELTRELKDKEEIEENLYKYHNDIKVADHELRQLNLQLDDLRADHGKSDRQIMALETKRDVTAISSLQMDKDYLKQQVKKHSGKRAEQDEVVKCQSFRLQQLEQRLQMVEVALRDLNKWDEVQSKLKEAMVSVSSLDPARDPCNRDQILPPDEVVDVELYELLNRDLSAITASLEMKRIVLEEKQAAIEATAYKVEDLAECKEEDQSYFFKQCAAFQRRTDSLDRQTQFKALKAREEANQIRVQIRDVRNKTLRTAQERAELERAQ